jgi:hypothetical protein
MIDQQAAIGISAPERPFVTARRLASWRSAAVTLVICGAAGALSVALGTDNNWDLLYYHLYAPYAYLHDRYLFDIGPAQFQGFFNPAADFLFYGLISSPLNETPRVIAFIMGAVHGLNAALILAIARHVLRPAGALQRSVLVAAALLIGASGAGFVSLVGTTTNDLIIAIFVLGSLLCLLKVAGRQERQPPWSGFAASGLLAGMAVGLKYTAACFFPGLALVALIAAVRRRNVAGPIAFGTAAMLAFAAIAGHHMLTLWRDFANPFFPNLNQIFQSPWYEPESIRDARFAARDIWQLIAYPFYWTTIDTYVVAELPFRDWRGAIAYVATAAGLLTMAAKRPRTRDPSRPACTETRGLGLVIVFAAVSLLFWELGFGIYRYAVALEMLTGVLAMGALIRTFREACLRVAAAVIVLALAGASTVYPDWGRGEYGEKYVDVRVPPLPPHSVVLVASWDPVSYFIPFAEPGTQFLGIENNYLTLAQTNRLASEVKRIMREPGRPKFVLNFGAFDDVSLNALLAHFGLKLDNSPCLPITQNLTEEEEALSLCPVAAG